MAQQRYQVVLLNQKEFNTQVNNDIRRQGRKFLGLMSRNVVAETKDNVPPQKRHWNAKYNDGYKPRGRLRRAIHTRKPKGRGNRQSVEFGVISRGHMKFSARVHEFGKVITSQKPMVFRLRPRGQVIVTKRVQINEKRYLRQGIRDAFRRGPRNLIVYRLP